MNNPSPPGIGRPAAVLDALPDGLVLVDDNGTLVSANSMALALFETPGTALVGRGLLDLLPDFDWRQVPGPVTGLVAGPVTGLAPGPASGSDGTGAWMRAGAGAGVRTGGRRMNARRTDGSPFQAEVSVTGVPDSGATGQLLVLVVRDLTGALDAEAELAEARRQTKAVLRAVPDGVVGTDADGRIVLVNPAAARMLGHRASELGGRELHPLALHSRADGEPFPFEESPLAETLRTGRATGVRGLTLWDRDGARLLVDLTVAPVRDGDRVAGAVLTFRDRGPEQRLAHRHAAELTAQAQRHGAELRRYEQRYEGLAERHRHLTAAVDGARRGHLEELRAELVALAADDAGHLWPEAGQLLGRLATGYARMAAVLDDVLDQQRLASGAVELRREPVDVGRVVRDGVRRSTELLGPDRARFALRSPSVVAEVDPERLAVALAHLLADVALPEGHAPTGPAAEAEALTTVVVAAEGGATVRIEVRGPYAGGDPLHQSIVTGIVGVHGGAVQWYEAPGTGGGVYVVELPVRSVTGTPEGLPHANTAPASAVPYPVPDVPAPASAVPPLPSAVPPPSGRRRRRARHAAAEPGAGADPVPKPVPAPMSVPTPSSPPSPSPSLAPVLRYAHPAPGVRVPVLSPM
ncbi:PAS domain-containing protein [Streptomyces sp. PTY087I2]|uniref:PAS domain-containing protein n=1 Tax=Streptomyces sp. PTY087I2 TaxID=1819298 RepID=UPI00080B4D07|nr:PAS domain-containing protein [Streptomyces sp. PTY087I2]OCC11586.1 Sensor histidine kinase DcuS [Streptomyces sp. PTY087I2]